MGIDLYMAGFTQSEFARCRHLRAEVETIYLAESRVLSRLGGSSEVCEELRAAIPENLTLKQWAIEWRRQPSPTIERFLTREEFDHEVQQILISDEEACSTAWERLPENEQNAMCKSCPVRHQMANDCSIQLMGVTKLNAAYIGIQTLVRLVPQIATQETASLLQSVKGTPLEPGVKNLMASKGHILIRSIQELSEYFHFQDPAVIESGQKGLGFYGTASKSTTGQSWKHLLGLQSKEDESVTIAQAFFGAFFFLPSDTGQGMTHDQMNYALPRLHALIEGCDSALFFVPAKEQNTLIAAQKCLHQLFHQMEIALRFGLKVRVSA